MISFAFRRGHGALARRPEALGSGPRSKPFVASLLGASPACFDAVTRSCWKGGRPDLALGLMRERRFSLSGPGAVGCVAQARPQRRGVSDGDLGCHRGPSMAPQPGRGRCAGSFFGSKGLSLRGFFAAVALMLGSKEAMPSVWEAC